jgi:putative ABC transport system permease protein
MHAFFSALRRDCGSKAAIVLTLACGVSAAATIYGVFNHVLFRPVPGVDHRASFVTITFRSPEGTASGFSSRDALPALRSAGHGSGLESLADWCCGSELMVSGPTGFEPRFEGVDFVGAQFFSGLRVRARLGRLLSDQECDGATEDVAVISERLWRDRFARNSDIIGSRLHVGAVAVTVVGVAADFRGWGHATPIGETDIWLPMASERRLTGSSSSMSVAVGRIGDGARVSTLEERLRSAYAVEMVGRNTRQGGFIPVVTPGLFGLDAGFTRDRVLRLYWPLMTGVCILLLLACLNAGILLLGLTRRRQQETAIRLALGATRWRIVRQVLRQSVSLAAIAAIMGAIVARWLMAAVGDMRLLEWLPALEGAALDDRVLLFCALVATATIVAFGVLPALTASRTDINGAMRQPQRRAPGAFHGQRFVITAQLAMAVALVAATSVLGRSVHRLLTADLGIDPRHVMTVQLQPQGYGYGRPAARDLIVQTMDAIRSEGFPQVAFSSSGAFVGGGHIVSARTSADAPTRRIALDLNPVTPGFFELLRMKVLSGRVLTAADVSEGTPEPVVVNAALAETLFGTPAAVARTFEFDEYSNVGPAVSSHQAVVIGVVGNVASARVRGAPGGALYRLDRAPTSGYLLVRSDEEPLSATFDRIRSVTKRMTPGLPAPVVQLATDQIARALSQDRSIATLGAIISLCAVLLAASGVAAVVGQAVSDRARDFGIRAALGARPGQIVRQVMGGVLTRSLLGAIAGIAIYAGFSSTLASRMFGISSFDPLTLSVVVGAMTAIAGLAAFVPARRASHADPASTLRSN